MSFVLKGLKMNKDSYTLYGANDAPPEIRELAPDAAFFLILKGDVYVVVYEQIMLPMCRKSGINFIQSKSRSDVYIGRKLDPLVAAMRK